MKQQWRAKQRGQHRDADCEVADETQMEHG